METRIKAGEQSELSPYTFVMSSSAIDRQGDIVMPEGIDISHFKKNPIALWSHNSNFPIGTWENIRVEGSKLLGDLKLAAAGTSKLIDELRSLVEQRILKAVSIGFGVDEAVPIKQTGGYKFTKTRLLECSLVSVPANQQALRVKGLSLSDEAVNLFFTSDDDSSNKRAINKSLEAIDKQTPLGAIQKPNPKLIQNPKGVKMNIAEKIKLNQERLIAIKDRLTVIKSEIEEGKEVSEEEIETLTGEQESVSKSIQSLEKVESGLASKSVSVKQGQFYGSHHHQAKSEPGELMAKVATANFIAHVERKNVDQVLEERYKADDRVNAVIKTATSIATTTQAGWAAELLRNDVAGFIDALRPVSVYGQLASMGTMIDFGNANTITVPRRNAAGNLSGAFVGETGVIPVKQGTTAAAQLNRYKMGVISTYSKELARVSTPQIEGLIRTAMLQDTADALDAALLDGSAAVTGVRPASIINALAGTASAGTSAANVMTDLRTALAPLITANAGAKPVIIMNSAQLLGLSMMTSAVGGFLFRDEINSGMLMGMRIISSTNVPAGNIIVVDAAHFATAFGMPEFDVSDSATLTMANADLTAPTQDSIGGVIGTAADQVPPAGGLRVNGSTGAAAANIQAMSMFQQWSVAVRMVMPVSWMMLRPGVIGRVTGATW